MQIKNQVIVLTGASAGIGAAAAKAFAAKGARLVLAARSKEALERLCAELPQPALAIPTDVSDPQQCQALIARTVAEYGRIDVLINNAGVGLAGPIAQLSLPDIERTIAVDMLGPLHLIQAALPFMRQQKRGHIVNVSSVLAAQTLPYLGGYAAAKAALERMSEALRMELRGTGISVSVLRPGTTRTTFTENRLGSGSEQRKVKPKGVPPELVAQTLVRVVEKRPRLAYVTTSDRLALLVSNIAPQIVDFFLSRAITWKDS